MSMWCWILQADFRSRRTAGNLGIGNRLQLEVEGDKLILKVPGRKRPRRLRRIPAGAGGAGFCQLGRIS